MQVELKETGQFARQLAVTVPAADVDKAFEHAYREVAKSARIPGFRPGKAPRSVIEAHYGSDVRREVHNRLVGDTLYKALDQAKSTPVGMPHIELGELSKGGAYSYSAKFEVQPEVELKAYKGLAFEWLDDSVPAQEVDEELERLRKQAAQLEPVMLRDVAQEGDVVLVDYEGFVDGAPFAGGKAENALVELGGDGYIPGFAEGLIGAKVPSERTVPVKFPDDYNAKELAGKSAEFKMRVKELKTRVLPPLDDELAKDMGEESLAALRQKIEDGLRERKERQVKGEQRKKVLEALVAANPFDLAPSMIDAESERIVQTAHARVEQMVGQRIPLSQEQVDNLKRENRANAELQVRSGLLLLKVAEQEKLEVTHEEIDAEIHRIAESSGEHSERVHAMLHGPQESERLRYRLLEDKTIQFLMDHAKGGAGRGKATHTKAEKASRQGAHAEEHT